MAETVSRQTAHLFAASREGVLALQLGPGDPQVFVWALYGTAIRCIATDGKGVLVAAGARDGRLLSTPDGGITWRPAAGYSGGEPRVLATEGSTLYLGGSPASLHRSDDGGSRFRQLTGLAGPWASDWRPTPGEEHARVSAVLLRSSRVVVAILAGGVMLSESGGEAFRKASDGLPAQVLAVAAPTTSDEEVLAGTPQGLHRTSRLGTGSWRSIFAPVERPVVSAVAVHPADPARIVCGALRRLEPAKPARPAGTDGAIYVSADGGESFRLADLGGRIIRGVITSILFLPSKPERVFVGTTSGEVFESSDRAESFRLTSSSLPGVEQLAVGPAFR